MNAKPFALCTVIIPLLCVNANGIDLPLKKYPSDRQNINQNNFAEYQKQLEDEDVRELKNLKSADGSSIAASKSQKFSYVNVNGQKEHNAEMNQQLNKNGELIGRIGQKINSKQNSKSNTPDTRVITEIEIPSKGIHKWFEQVGEIRDNIQKKTYNIKQKNSNIDNAIVNNLLDTFKMKNVIRYLPVEMAEYIYKTGDEKTVTAVIENYLQLGVLDREEAIEYLQEIKTILNNIEEEDQRDKKREQQRYAGNTYGDTSQNKVNMNQALSDLKDVQQLVQRKFLKKSYNEENRDIENERYRYDPDEREHLINSYIEENDVQFHPIEKNYRNVEKKLQNFENLFSQSSMDGVIYQLAKVLFYQSFSMNGFEAQESLKQFTTFLEAQVNEGRISRQMERKVLDILLAALTDTLTEHPELIHEKHIERHQKQKRQSENIKKEEIEQKNLHPKMNLKLSGILDDDNNRQ